MTCSPTDECPTDSLSVLYHNKGKGGTGHECGYKNYPPIEIIKHNNNGLDRRIIIATWHCWRPTNTSSMFLTLPFLLLHPCRHRFTGCSCRRQACRRRPRNFHQEPCFARAFGPTHLWSSLRPLLRILPRSIGSNWPSSNEYRSPWHGCFHPICRH